MARGGFFFEKLRRCVHGCEVGVAAALIIAGPGGGHWGRVSIIRSLIIIFTLPSYLGTVLLCSFLSVLLLSVEACVFTAISPLETSSSSFSGQKLHLKKSWGMPVLFLSSDSILQIGWFFLGKMCSQSFGGGVFSGRHVMGTTLSRQVGCMVAEFDRHGWGLTSRPCAEDWEENEQPNPNRHETKVDLLLSFCCEIELNSVVLIGHDDGGLLALKAGVLGLMLPSQQHRF